MRVTVFGASGMLGTEVCSELVRSGHSVIAATHAQGSITNYKFVRQMTEDCDFVINCAGMINHGLPSDMVYANGVGPWIIAQNTNKPIIHVSTDCVFSGTLSGRPNFIGDAPSPYDLYGRSKLLGEVRMPHVCNVRTSFVGLQHGLLRWLINNANSEIFGRIYCQWSGSTVQAVAESLVTMVLLDNRKNIEHLATERPMSKYDLLIYLNDLLRLNCVIKPANNPVINRSLRPTIVLPAITTCGDDLSARYFSGYTSWTPSKQPTMVGSSD